MGELGQRAQEFLVHVTGGVPDLSMASASPVFNQIGGLPPNVRRIDKVSSATLTLQSAGPSAGHTTLVVVADTAQDEATMWRRVGQAGSVSIAPNQLLQHFDAGPRIQLLANPPRAVTPVTIQLRIQDSVGNPIPNAVVQTFGANTAQGASDRNGNVTLTFFTGATNCDAIYIKPAMTFWEKWINNPDLQSNMTVTLRRLEDWPPAKFSPAAPYANWATALLGLDVTDQSMNGAGIKVAVADSGCDVTHSLASGFHYGVNYADPANPNDWNTDSIGHGTWCSTLIGGFDPVTGRRGYAPQAEMHTLKIFPGGSLATLQRCFTYCVDNGIDVMSLSLGTPNPDVSTTTFINDALQHGIAIFVAAGNSYGPVSYPASVPGTFAVSAVGQGGRFPPDTYHAQTQTQQTRAEAVGNNGLFAPDFTAAGPEISFCALGVATTSGTPGNGFVADDGTSMACPAIAALATLALAHHPVLRGQPRSKQRTMTLSRVLQDACQNTGLAAGFNGAGMPNIKVMRDRVHAPMIAPGATANAAMLGLPAGPS